MEGRFDIFQRFLSNKLELKTVESRFIALHYYKNGSNERKHGYIMHVVCKHMKVRSEREHDYIMHIVLNIWRYVVKENVIIACMLYY